MSLLKKIINLILYSNFFIAACAVALTFQTQYLLQGFYEFSPVIGLVLCATLVIYALHRLVGLFKLQDFIQEGRYFVINKFKSHIWIYAVLGISLGAYFFFQCSSTIKIALVLPAFFSLGYVLPIFGKNRNLRLRDFGELKIFLVATVWAYVTVLLPALEIGIWDERIPWMFLERSLFMFAITLPFDIRDLRVDIHNNVKTIPSIIGIQKTKIFAAILLIIMLTVAFFSYEILVFYALLASAISTMYLIYISPKQTHDYFFTALLDGTMIIQFLLVLLLTS